MLSFVGCGVLQYIDKVVDVLGTRLLYGGLWKDFTYFLRARAVCLESGPYFLEPLVLAATCSCALRQSTEVFVYFLREKWTPSSPRSSHPGNLNIISASSIWQPPRASVYVAFGRISLSHFLAQFAVENLDIFPLAVIWRWEGFSAVLTHFSRSSGLSRS